MFVTATLDMQCLIADCLILSSFYLPGGWHLLQERKRQIVASAFGENEGGEQKTRLTVEDLRYLFRV